MRKSRPELYGGQSKFTRHHAEKEMAPEVGFEPTTKRLTAARSTTELLRSESDRPNGLEGHLFNSSANHQLQNQRS